jgi:hypothetical protein
MGQSDVSAGLQAHRSGGVQIAPVVRLDSALRRVMGRLLRRSGRRRARLSCLLHQGISAICPSSQVAGPRGARDALCRRRLPRVSARHVFSAANTVKARCRNTCVGLSACAGSEVRAEVATAGSRASLNSNCQKTGESIFISNDVAHCMQSRRQRFPTVRMVG